MIIKSSLIEAQLEALAADPAPGKNGRVFFHTGEKIAKLDTGTAIGPIGQLPFNNVTANTQAISMEQAYLANHITDQVVFTLPATASIGTRFLIVGYGVGGWKIAQNAGQSIILEGASTTTGIEGFIQSSYSYSVIEVECIVADTTFKVIRTLSASFIGGTFAGRTYGYLFGGGSGGVSDKIIEFTMATQQAANLVNVLPATRSGGCGLRAPTMGYEAGGDILALPAQNSIVGFTFSTKLAANLATTLSGTRRMEMGLSFSTAGYILGGDSGGNVNIIDRLTFGGVCVALVAVLSVARNGGTAVQNSTIGWVMGGDGGTQRLDRFTFGTETVNNLGDTLIASRVAFNQVGVSSSTNGYQAGNAAPATVLSKLNFSTEAFSDLAAVLGTARQKACAITGIVKGWFSGGTAAATTIDDLVYSGETSDTLVAVLPQSAMLTATTQI